MTITRGGLAAVLVLLLAGCKSAVIPDYRASGTRAETTPVVEIQKKLNAYKLLEIERATGAPSTFDEDFRQGLSDRLVDMLNSQWMFEAVTPVVHAEVGRQLAPTLQVRMVLGWGDDEARADVSFVDRESGDVLGRYRLSTPLKGTPPFGGDRKKVWDRFTLAIYDILNKHGVREGDERFGG